MRKNWFKRIATMGLVCSMVAGLCACGGSRKNENAALAKEHVYKVQEIELPQIDGDDYNIYASTHRDGEIRLMIEVYHWSSEKNQTDIRIMSIAEDGSDVQMSKLDIPKWEPQVPPNTGTEPGGEPDGGIMPLVEPRTEADPGAEGDDEGQEDPQVEGDPEAEGQGDSAAEEGAEGEGDTEAEEEAGIEEPVAEPDYGYSDISENSYYSNYLFGGDGRMYAIRSYNYSDYANEIYNRTDYIACWNQDGSFQWEKELEGLHSEEEWIYVNTMFAAEDGTLTIMLSGDQAYQITVDPQGNASERKPLSEDVAKLFNNYDSIIDKGDGTILLVYNDENDWTKKFIATYDPATETLGQSTAMPTTFGTNGYGNLTKGLNTDLLCSTGDGIYTYKIGDQDFTQKMNFINSDLYIGNFSSIVELSDTSFLGVYYENYSEGMKAGIFTYVDPKDIPDKDVLVLAGTYIGGDMERRVVKFNRESDKYRIVVKSYDNFNTYDDWQAGYTQLNNDVTTGNMPDILITDGLPVENYVSKGLLEDIGKMIEEDPDLSQVEFVQNVFDAYSVEGKLYYVIPSFMVSTMIAKESIVGDRTSWTMEEMLQLQASLPEGTNMIGELTRSGFFSTMMRFCGSDFVDIDTGKCDFDTENFIAMMEFAKKLPEELSEDYYSDESFWANYDSQYRDERTILCSTSFGTIRDLNYTVNGYFGGDVAFIGFPTQKGIGSYLMANECYAISSKSHNKEGAWEFLRYYLTEEYQSENAWGMPTQKKYFDEMAKAALERPFWQNEDGTKEEYDDYFNMNGESIKLDPLSQEQVDRIVNFICSIDKCYYYNESIMNIINEEMDAFYTGQKSAQEVAKTIQNRAQLYVDENR